MPSKFKPTRERKHRKLARQSTPEAQPSSAFTDSNTAVLTTTKSEREERRQKLRDELRAQQPKVSAKKSKRLDKYIEKKLKKDESADLVRKLEQEKGKFDVSGLQSSKRLKRKFGDFVNGQVGNDEVVVEGVQRQLRSKGHEREARSRDDIDDSESVDSFEEEHEAAFDPATEPAEDLGVDNAWLKKRAPPVQGTGLAVPLHIGRDGIPIIPVRNGKRRKEEIEAQDEDTAQPAPFLVDTAADTDDWEGFSDHDEEHSQDDDETSLQEQSDEEDEMDIDPRLKNIDGKVLDALLAELQQSESSDHDSDETDNDAIDSGAEGIHISDEEAASDEGSEDESQSEASSETSISSNEDTKLKPRTSAFKSWATQQLNHSIGHTPFYEQSDPDAQIKTQNQLFEKPAAGFRLGVQEAERPEDDRRAYTVHVARLDSIQEARSQLPILQREQEIMEAIHNNQVVVIKGDTGSGKTTQLPQFLFEAGFGDKTGPMPGMIGITQPRRVAAVSMAKRVAEELGDHGDEVAHQIRFDTTVSSKTAVKFMTDGILLRELSQDLLLKKYSVIVIDEAHERSVNTDLLIGMLSKIVPARTKKSAQNPDPQPLKLIIMSATLNIDDFLQEKLFSPSMRPPIVEAEGRQHRVTTHFALRSRSDYLEEVIEKVKRAHRKLPRGGILVFLTGQNEIKHVLSQLRKDLIRSAKPVNDSSLPRVHISAADAPLEMDDLDIGSHDYKSKVSEEQDDIDILTDEAELDREFEVSDDEEEQERPPSTSTMNHKPHSRDPYDTVHLLPLYSQLPTAQQLLIFEEPPDRARPIILATNVAETSLTIPNVRYVIDCGRSKERRFNADTGVQSFEIDYISKASAMQRSGRAGRTGPGHCWRLYSSAVFEQYFPEHTEPEILRTPAESVVLQVKGFRYPRPVADFPFPSPPSRAMLEKAERLLSNLGAISGANGALTELGRKLSMYPLAPRLGKILVNAIEQPKVVNELVALVAALSVEDVFINETQLGTNATGDDDEHDKIKQQCGRAHALFSKHDKSSDALKLFTAVQMYLNAADKESFCQQYFLRSKAMNEISLLCGQLRGMVQVNHPALSEALKTWKAKDHLKADALKGIHAALSSGYIDQIALRCDAHPTPPTLPRRPTRATDVPYLPLTPLKTASCPSDIIDKAVFIHPSSLLSRLSIKSLPEYIVYRHLQTSQPGTVGGEGTPKTRMLPLCTLDAQTLLTLIRDTGLIEYGKPVAKTKVEDISGTRPKERICWVSTTVKREKGSGGFGWPLPPSRVRQVMDLKEASGWRVVEVLA